MGGDPFCVVAIHIRTIGQYVSFQTVGVCNHSLKRQISLTLINH